jgi:hypothetical protein
MAHGSLKDVLGDEKVIGEVSLPSFPGEEVVPQEGGKGEDRGPRRTPAQELSTTQTPSVFLTVHDGPLLLLGFREP